MKTFLSYLGVFMAYVALFFGIVFGFKFLIDWTVDGKLPLADPKFKVGDCITDKPIVGEFTTKESGHYFLIKKVGEKSYLTTFYGTWSGSKHLINDNYELDIKVQDRVGQLVDPSECQVKE